MKLYIVRWLHDYYYRETAFSGGDPDCPTQPRLVKAFIDPIAAETYRSQLERGLRTPPAEANPFLGFRERSEGGLRFVEGRRFQRLADLTTLPEPILADWLSECYLTPPSLKSGRGWADWWDANAPHMTDYQRARVWQALDKLRFFEVIETELEV